MESVGQEGGHIVRQKHLMDGGLAFQDALAGGQIGLVDDGQETGADAGEQLSVEAG